MRKLIMKSLEEAIRNIDVFCRVLVEKIVEDENCPQNIVLEPVKKLLRGKYIVEEHFDLNPLARNLISLTHAEEPLIDIYENDEYVEILIQCRPEDYKMTISKNIDGLEICAEKCRKINVPIKNFQVKDMIIRRNNKVLEISIPKMKTTVI
jgi:hypothetical protein